MVKSQSAVEHYLLKTCARGWIFVLVAIQNDSLSVFMQVCLFKICKCHLQHVASLLYISSHWLHSICAPIGAATLSQHCLSLLWCFLRWHPESHIICKNNSCWLFSVFFPSSFLFFFIFFFYSSRKILASVRYSMSITGKSNKSVRLRL